MKRLTSALLLVALAYSAQAQPIEKSTGLNCLFIGHSFFVPVAKELEDQARQAGLSKHRQKTVFSGGASGSPKSLWEGKKRPEIQQLLKTGKVELLGMTYYPERSSVKDYQRWIDYALQHNPDTCFFIGHSWGKNGPTRELSEYSEGNRKSVHALYHEVVVELRKHYPKNTIDFINYGKAAIEIKKRFETDKLKGVEAMVGKEKGRSGAVFRDPFGHAGPMILDLSALVWLEVLYGVDVTSKQIDLGYATDLRPIAHAIALGEKDWNSKGK